MTSDASTLLEQDMSSDLNTVGERENKTRWPRSAFFRLGVPLHQAAIKGDWAAARSILAVSEEAIRNPVTESDDIALHVAISVRQTSFARELLRRMKLEDLRIKNNEGCTALHASAMFGVVEIAREIVSMDKGLLLMHDNSQLIPLHIAAFCGNREVALFLFDETKFEDLDYAERIDLFLATISGDLYDVALQILARDGRLALAEDRNGQIALQLLSRKTSWIGARSELSVWEKLLNSCCNRICDKALLRTSANRLVHDLWNGVRGLPKDKFFQLLKEHSSLLTDAAELGNAQFLSILKDTYPDVAKFSVGGGEKVWNILHIAISYRQEKIFHLLQGDTVVKNTYPSCILENEENLLHLAALMPRGNRLNTISGAPFQMQRELLWFKEIEKIVPPSHVKSRNSEGKTPYDVFVEEHEHLRKNGEEWMKGTTRDCMVVAILIMTIILSALLAIPGGFVGKIPTLLKDYWFSVFLESDAIAFFSSLISILVFISILKSRYEDRDFLSSLPVKLVTGLVALFISMAGMTGVYSAAYILVYTHKRVTTLISIIAVAAIPISVYSFLHCHFWFVIIRTTFRTKFLFRSCKRWFF